MPLAPRGMKSLPPRAACCTSQPKEATHRVSHAIDYLPYPASPVLCRESPLPLRCWQLFPPSRSSRLSVRSGIDCQPEQLSLLVAPYYVSVCTPHVLFPSPGVYSPLGSSI